jgi:hypothetical protein
LLETKKESACTNSGVSAACSDRHFTVSYENNVDFVSHIIAIPFESTVEKNSDVIPFALRSAMRKILFDSSRSLS